jgi:hypothetical protein
LTDIDDLEVEEAIIIKALIDYNTSKFSNRHEASIEAIINDVFEHHSSTNREEQKYGTLSDLV